MPFLFVSKYEQKHRLESARESLIQAIQANQRCTREYAVKYYDYTKHKVGHEAIKLASCALYTFGAYKFIQAATKDIPLMQKSWVKLPILAGGFWLGRVLYDKLVSHYLNIHDMNVAHIWEMDLKEKYGVNHFQGEETEVPLTPFERLQKNWMDNLSDLNIEGQKQYKRLSKDRNNFYYMYGKVRNLENIVYLDDKTAQSAKNSIELQMRIDSTKPTLHTTGDINSHVDELHQNIESLKYEVENSRNFRSIKDKFLGLPFMMHRHQQYPTPVRGTWQFDVFEKMFGEAYDSQLGMPESEEKINKFNYHLFLHPSVIERWDTTSEEFDLFLRQLNVESHTKLERRAKQREYFCKSILPILNLTEDKELGFDFANYVMNKNKDDGYKSYLYDSYSGQKEEALFREAEEAKYVNKNQPFVQRVNYNNIDKSKAGMRAAELNDLLNNPTAAKKMRKALETKYGHYNPTKYIDQLRFDAKVANYYNTIIDREIDTTSPDFNMDDLHALQYDKGENADNPEEEALGSFHVNFPRNGHDVNNNPYGIKDVDVFAYIPKLDWNDYVPDGAPEANFISPKRNRFEMFAFNHKINMHQEFFRGFNSAEFADRVGWIVPGIDYKNEELKQRVLFRSNYHRFKDMLDLKDSEKEKLEFLESKTMDDSYGLSDDVTEEELDQALFEATYTKPLYETEEFRSFDKRNHKEMEQIFKVVGFEAGEMWYEPPTPRQLKHNRPLTDKAELLDPLTKLYSEVEQPHVMREYLQKWRSGAEMRFKLPYYPETKAPTKSFNYI